MLYDNFILTDDKFLQPTYRISPFRTNDLVKNRGMRYSDHIDEYFTKRFNNKKYIYTISGREALNKALKQLKLEKDDIVTIFTTSGNFYISGCVTKEIEKFCFWSRKIENNTKVLLVNHEFGFPYEGLSKLLNYKLPIIEDCAHSFISQNQEHTVGKIGDYVIYSLPKFFPIQFGGILVSNRNSGTYQDISIEEEKYLKAVLSYYINDIEKIKAKRSLNYKYLEDELIKIKFTPRFLLKDTYCPGAYLFRTEDVDLDELKIYLQNHGVECSVFYGEETFFIPVNQSLEHNDIDYFLSLIKSFINK